MRDLHRCALQQARLAWAWLAAAARLAMALRESMAMPLADAAVSRLLTKTQLKGPLVSLRARAARHRAALLRLALLLAWQHERTSLQRSRSRLAVAWETLSSFLQDGETIQLCLQFAARGGSRQRLGSGVVGS